MAVSSPYQAAFGQSFVFLAEVRFAGAGFLLSLAMLWALSQGIVQLAVRFSRHISKPQPWRSGILALLITVVMILSWPAPAFFSRGGEDDLIWPMSSAIIFGAAAGWFLCGRLYRLEFMHRFIVSVAIPVAGLCTLALGRFIQWKWLGG